MTMKKIMFNDKYGLTEAVLNGEKTQTRRVLNEGRIAYCLGDPHVKRMLYFRYQGINACIKPEYQVGEVVAVAQSYQSIYQNYPCFDWMKTEPGWNNKMFVASGVMPHHIRITNIRVERLQDISNEDCLKEGVTYNPIEGYSYFGNKGLPFYERRNAFASLIKQVSGNGTWDKNPYVFVYDFELVD